VSNPADDVPHFELDALVAEISDENRHDEIPTGPAVGEEFG